MTTYYVRKTGNDGNAGTTAGAAWLTVDKAANEVAAGDTVYIGSGVYRELVTMDTSGTSGNEINFIGDIDGVQTGDPGPVIISANDAVDGAQVRDYCLVFTDKEFFTWQYVTFVGALARYAAAVYAGTPAAGIAYEGVVFKDCAIAAGRFGYVGYETSAMTVVVGVGDTPTGDGLQVLRCAFIGQLTISHTNNAVQHENLKMNIDNCVFMKGGDQLGQGVMVTCGTSNTYSVGGIEIWNCIFMLGMWSNCVWFNQYCKNTTNRMKVMNCIAMSGQVVTGNGTNTANTIDEDYNISWAKGIIGSGGGIVTGGHSDASVETPLMGGLADLMFYNKLGWSPWKPWEPLTFFDGSFEPVQTGFVSTATIPSDDIYGNPRPMGRNTGDAGAVEARARPQDETATFYAGSHSAKLAGAGYYDVWLPVTALSTTISVQARYDSNHTGSLPLLEVLEIPGVADQSDVMTAAADTWEALSCTFTPGSAGYIRVRLRSRDTSANGECFFDSLGVS